MHGRTVKKRAFKTIHKKKKTEENAQNSRRRKGTNRGRNNGKNKNKLKAGKNTENKDNARQAKE